MKSDSNKGGTSGFSEGRIVVGDFQTPIVLMRMAVTGLWIRAGGSASRQPVPAPGAGDMGERTDGVGRCDGPSGARRAGIQPRSPDGFHPRHGRLCRRLHHRARYGRRLCRGACPCRPGSLEGVARDDGRARTWPAWIPPPAPGRPASGYRRWRSSLAARPLECSRPCPRSGCCRRSGTLRFRVRPRIAAGWSCCPG